MTEQQTVFAIVKNTLSEPPEKIIFNYLDGELNFSFITIYTKSIYLDTRFIFQLTKFRELKFDIAISIENGYITIILYPKD